MSGTRTTIEADGVPFFEGEARSIWPSSTGGGGGSGAGILDLRWDTVTRAIQITRDGTNWVEGIVFYPWDA